MSRQSPKTCLRRTRPSPPVLLRRRRPEARVAVALLAVAWAGGCGEPEEDVSPNFEDRIPLGLELEAKDRVLVWGDSSELTGRLTQGEERLVGETVVLEADSYPHDGDFAEVESIETSGGGEFAFSAEPDANTDYRVAAGEGSEATSDRVRVFVEPRIEIETEAAGNGTRFTSVFRHPDDRSIQGSNVFAYAATVADAEATGKLNFIRAVGVEQERLGLSTASVTLPFSADEVRYETCESYTPDSGMGEPNPECSQTRIPYP